MARRQSDAANGILERIAVILENLDRRQPQGSTEYRELREFKKNNPPSFTGKYDPEGAHCWLQELEKIFRTMLCTDTQKVIFATYMLVGEAEYWWNFTRQQLEVEGRGLTWETFKERFLEKYFPEDIRRRKEVEFLELKQGDMSIGEYATKFEELSKYFPYYQHEIDEGSRCIRFENGLRPDIKPAISYQEIRHFPTLVNKCRIYEGDIKARQAYQLSVYSQGNYGLQEEKGNMHPRVKRPYQQVYIDKELTVSNQGPFPTTNPPIATPPRCEKCRRLHYSLDCPDRKRKKCFFCGKPGHFRDECPVNKKKGDKDHPQSKRPKRS